MLENLQYCLNATLPIFILLFLGMCFMRIGVFSDEFVQKLNDFVFKIPLPVLVFSDLCSEDFYSVWDTKLVLFCFFATLLSILLTFFLSLFLKDKTYRANSFRLPTGAAPALLGVTLMQNLYGSSSMAPLMIIGCVPLYNAAAVIILSFFKPERRPLDKRLFLSTAKGIATNPIIIGIVCGLLWALLQLPMPRF